MLTGTFYHWISPKGRITMPHHFRRHFGHALFLTRAPHGCVLAVSRRQWQLLHRRNLGDPTFRGYFLSGSSPARIDSAGRVHVPAALQSWAKLIPGEQAAVVGIGGAVVICPRVRWDEQLQRQEELILASLTGAIRQSHQLLTAAVGVR